MISEIPNEMIEKIVYWCVSALAIIAGVFIMRWLDSKFGNLSKYLTEIAIDQKDITKTVSTIDVRLAKMDGEKMGWEDYRLQKKRIEEDRQKDIKLHIAKHIEKDHK